MAEERFDGLLLNIASHTQGIDELLDVFLGFLRRKTDTYNPPGGFPQLEKAFVGALRTQYDIAQSTKSKQTKATAQSKAAQSAPAPAKPASSASTAKSVSLPAAAPAPPKNERVLELGADGSFDVSSAPAVVAPKPAPAVASPKPNQASALKGASTTKQQTAAPALGEVPSAEAQDAPSEEAAGNGGDKPNHGNGGVTEHYTWTQTLGELTVNFPVPPGIKPRDVAVDIKAGSLKVGIKGQPPIIDAPLPHKVAADDSYWTLDDEAQESAPTAAGSDGERSKTLTVYLTKQGGMEWWESVATGQPRIDITKINPESSKLSDLDGPTRSTVEKMMFDQAQKARGLPTSDEQARADALKRFMGAHPEMDFSQAKFM